MDDKQIDKMLEEAKRQGYSVQKKGFSIILAPENFTRQTAGLVAFGQEIDVDAEIGDMIEHRGLKH